MKGAIGAAFIGALSTTVRAHSWVEQLMVVDSNGTMVGQPGYARGNVHRGTPAFSDPTMVNLIPPDGGPINVIAADTLMCKSTQTTMNVTNNSPRLQAPAGAMVALRYQENGHVTLPQNQPGKPPNRGTLYVYGTNESLPTDEFLKIHRVWNAAGTGGDGRGVLLSTQNFDDGQCYQVNSGTISQERQKEFPHTPTVLTGADLWCQTDVLIPSTTPNGQPYTMYWVWDWPTLPGTAGYPNGKQEFYTTCLDIDITNSAPSQLVTTGFIDPQDLNAAAIETEIQNIANATYVSGSTIPFSSTSGASVTPAPATTSASPVVSTSANTVTSATATPGTTFASVMPNPSPSVAPASFFTQSGTTVTASASTSAPAASQSTVTVTNIQTITAPVVTQTQTQASPSAPSAPSSLSVPLVSSASSNVAPALATSPTAIIPLNTWGNWSPATVVSVHQAAAARLTSVVTVTKVDTAVATVYQTIFDKRAQPSTVRSSTDHEAYRLRARALRRNPRVAAWV